MTHFNNLPAAPAERLAMLSEEAGEIIQAIGKVFRHGYESTHPNGGPTNREALAREVGDFLGVMDAMCRAGDLDREAVENHRADKWQRAWPYTHHQGRSP